MTKFDGHPLTSLLYASGYELLSNKYNYTFYIKLSDALQKDGKSASVNYMNDVPRMIRNPIHGTEDLFEGEHEFAHMLVASWAESVMSPFVDSLLELIHKEDEDGYLVEVEMNDSLVMYFDGSMIGGSLVLDGNFEEYWSLASEADAEDKVVALLDEWSNSLEFVLGVEDFLGSKTS